MRCCLLLFSVLRAKAEGAMLKVAYARIMSVRCFKRVKISTSGERGSICARVQARYVRKMRARERPLVMSRGGAMSAASQASARVYKEAVRCSGVAERVTATASPPYA